jgi:membrane fusion protein, multidrug efflux system
MDVAVKPQIKSSGDRSSATHVVEAVPKNAAKLEAPEAEVAPTPRPEPDRQGDDVGNVSADASHERTNKPSEKKPAWRLVRDHVVAFGVSAVLLVAILIAGMAWWLNSRHYESTDDAFVDGRPVAISALVAGSIVGVLVTDNQLVLAGTVLARIDERDYLASQAQAKAQTEQAQAGIANTAAQVETQQSQIDQTVKQVTQQQSALSFSKDQNARAQKLVEQGAGTVQNAQQTASDLQGKQAALDAAVAAESQAEKQLGVLKALKESGEAQLRQAQAQSDQAAANLSRVVLQAPVEGRVTKLTAAVGAYAAVGQTLMMLVPTDLWVTANYKETQLADMRPGQPVMIEIDAYGRDFPGHVDSIQRSSGDAFSLLPAENATGNYVKVVQRVPVKIVFDKPPDVAIGPGMSVLPSAKVR